MEEELHLDVVREEGEALGEGEVLDSGQAKL